MVYRFLFQAFIFLKNCDINRKGALCKEGISLASQDGARLSAVYAWPAAKN